MGKRIAFINAVPYGSTGRIVQQISDYCLKQGDQTIVGFSWTKRKHQISAHNTIRGSFVGKIMHILLGRTLGLIGCFSILDTIILTNKLKKFKPDVINLHLLHSWSFNLPILFRYIRNNNIPVVWTMHDCWAVTGHCPHFTIVNCNKWTSGCYKCPQYKEYPSSLIDSSKIMWRLKKNTFTSVKDMVIVTPSKWLESIIKKSFLQAFPTQVINNGLDLDFFKPIHSNFREKYFIEETQFVLLGVSFDWSYKKGLDVFIELAELLDDRFKIVLVGIDDQIIGKIPNNILAIKRTQNLIELAKIYTAADLFINPTREEVLGMVNLEALACGTPVISFNTGGSPECFDSTCGIVTNNNNVNDMYNKIMKVYKERPFSTENCVDFARKFSTFIKCREYLDLLHKNARC